MSNLKKSARTHDSPEQLHFKAESVGSEELYRYEDHRQFCDILSSKAHSLISVCEVGDIALLDECDSTEANLNLPYTRLIQF